MRKNLLLLLIVAGTIFSSFVTMAQCYSSPNGQWPSGTITPTCNGTPFTVTSAGWNGEYSVVSLTAGVTYTFRSSVTTDYITVDNNGAAPLVGVAGVSGLAGQTWTCTATGTYRFYTHNDAACGSGTVSRTRSIQCGSAAVAPANDLCANATALPCGTSNLAGTTVGTTTTGDANIYSSSYGVWYSFVGNGQNTTITSVAGFDHEMTAYSGSCASKTYIATIDGAGSGSAETLSFATTNGTTYYVYVAHWSTSSTTTGTFTISRTCSAPPANPCTSATALTCGTAANYTLAAGNGVWNQSQPGWAFLTPGNERIFTFTPATTGSYNIELTNNEGYVDLFVGTTCGASSLTYVDDISTSGATNAVTLNAGTLYYILLDDENTTESSGTIKISTNLGTPVISGNTQLCGTGTIIQQYNFAAVTGATSYTWSVSGVGMILQGGSAGTPGVNKNITFTGAFTSGTLTLTANSACGSKSTTVNIQRAGGDFVINSFPYTNSGNTIGAGNNFQYTGSLFITSASEEHAYKVEVSCEANYTFSLCGGATWDSYLVLTSDICSNPTVIATNDDFCSLQSQISANLTPGVYYLMVEGYGATDGGSYTLNVTQAPPTMGAITGLTNICGSGAATATLTVPVVSGATSYTWSLPAGMTGSSTTNSIAVSADASFNGGTVSVSATTCAGVATQSVNVTRTIEDLTVSNQFSNSNNNVGNGNNSSLRGSEDVIYKWDVTCPGTYTISTCGGATWDTYLYLISDLPCNSYSTIASNDDNCSLQSSMTATVAAGTYYIVVEGFGSTSGGSYTLNVTGETPAVSINSVSNYNGFGVSCNAGSNGTVSASAVNGTNMEYSIDGGASYQSSGDFSGLSAGTYTITARNCVGNTSTASFTVTEPTPVTAAIVGSDYNGYGVSCFGSTDGTADATANGGAGGYSYSWSNGSTSEDLSGLAAGAYSVTVTDANGCSASADVTLVEPTKVNISATNTEILCFGGNSEVTVVTSGGVTPYTVDDAGTYSVPAGSYTYDIVDANGCQASTSLNITEPTLLVASSSAPEILCNGGSTDVTVSAAGGTAPYSGEGVYNVAAGSYTYTVTDNNGCTSITTINVAEPALLTVGLVASDYNGYGVSCFGSTDGSVDATANGGTGAYNYSWSNGSTSEDLSGLGAGNFTVTVTDANGCSASADVTLVEPTKVNISATNTEILCFGGNSEVTVVTSGGVTPYTVDDAGTYSVPAGSYTYDIVDANGCSASTSLTISQPTLLTVNAGSDETVFYGYGPMECADLSASANGGTGAYSYSWSSTATGGGMGSTLTACPTANEVYTVTVTDANGCQATDEVSICVVDVHCQQGNSNNFGVEMCQIPPGNPANAHTICVSPSAVPAHLAIGCQLGACGELAAACSGPAAKSLQSDELAVALTAYPNPTENTTTVSVTLTKAGNYSVEMYDMMGKLIKTVYAGSFEEYENLEFDVDMTNLNTGVYMISVMNGDQKIENIRVMKN